MDSSRRLQQLQQTNSHLAPLAAPQLGQHNAADYRPRSPLFPQIQSQGYNNNPDGSKTPLLHQYSQDPYDRRYDEYGRQMAAAPLLLKQQTHHHHHENDNHHQQQQQLPQQRSYQAAPMTRAPSQQFQANQMYQQFSNQQHNHTHNPQQHQQQYHTSSMSSAMPPQQPSSPSAVVGSFLPNSTSSSSISSRSHQQQPVLLQEQYRQLQRARTQQRIECQARAALNQQRTFAARQAAIAAASGNPAIACASPVPSVVVSVTPANSRLQGSDDGFNQEGSLSRRTEIETPQSEGETYASQNHRRLDTAQQENLAFNPTSHRRPPAPGVDNSQQDSQGYKMNSNNRRHVSDNAQQDNQTMHRKNDNAQLDNQMFNQRRPVETMQQDIAQQNTRRPGNEDNQMLMGNRRSDNLDNRGLAMRRPGDDNINLGLQSALRKVDGSESQNTTASTNNNKARDNVRSPITVMQPPPTSVNNSRREVLPPNPSSVSTRERMQSPVPTINMSQQHQQVPQVPPKPSAQTARHAQQNLYVQPHPHLINADSSIVSPVGSPGAPTYASSPANMSQNASQKYNPNNQVNALQSGPNNNQQQYYNQQTNMTSGPAQYNQQYNQGNHQPNNQQQQNPNMISNQQFYQQSNNLPNTSQPNDQINSQPSTPQHQPAQPQRSKSIASSITSSISSNSIMVRGPVARRPVDSVVTISGWLHKQGCDGLKVWRKRWFVLTDYCLFYYKGQEEEKLLGSILLPSYTVSICTPDEKHHRRNSFKCEHANMRTYVLAADTPEAMALWVRALRDACTMQCDENSHQSQPSASTINNSDTSASLVQHANAPAPQVMNQQHHNMINQQQQQILNQQQQPLYANAPHRLRTISAPGCYSPTPESAERYEESIYTTRPQSRRIHHEMARSPIPSDAIYETQQQLQQSRIHQQPPNMAPNVSNLHPGANQSYTMDHNMQKQHMLAQRQNAYKTMPASGTRDLRSPYEMEQAPYMTENPDNIIRAPRRFQNPNEEYDHYVQNNAHAAMTQSRSMQKSNERRTPDTYGRSRHARQQYAANALAAAGGVMDPGTGMMQPHPAGNAGDYEDLYNAYKRPMSPAPNSPTTLTAPPLNPSSRAELERRGIILPHGYNDEQPMAPVQMRQKQNKRQPNIQQAPVANSAYQPKRNAIPRPHSADFLEYEIKSNAKQAPGMQAVSAHNLAMNQNTASVIPGVDYSGNRSARDRLMRQRPKSSLDMPISDQMYYSEKSYAEMMRQSALYVDAVKSGGMDGTGNRQRILGGGRMYEDNGANDIDISNKLHSMQLNNDTQNYDEEIREMSSYSHNREFVNSYSVPRQGKDQHSDNGSNQFARSASARLFRNNKDQDDPSEQGAKKVQQREESMKRLLEWKQRMLQAPLTRNTSGTLNSASSSNNISGNANRTMSPAALHSDGSVPMNSIAATNKQQRHGSYNSYSSDDEASITNKLGVYTKASTLPMRTVSPRLRLSQEKIYQSSDKFNSQKANGNEYATKTDYDKYYRRNLYKYDDSTLPCAYSNSGKYPYKTDTDHYGSREGFLKNYDGEYGSREMFVDAEYGSRDNLLNNDMLNGEYADRSYGSRSREDWSGLRRSGSQVDDMNFIERDQINRHLNVSAGDLLGRTHEELVLLLIQLRRQNASTARAMEQCCSKIHHYQSRLGKQSDDTTQRQENLQKLNALKRHLLDLEKQYEKGKPLVNLVDNMVKLGALYKGNGKPNLQKTNGSYLNDKLEFNQRLEERRLLKEEQKYWDSANVDEQQLQNKMRQLQEYGEQLREQSNTLQGLRKDEESLRGALASLKTRMQQGQQAKQNSMQNTTAAGRVELLEKAREQERALERELTKVRELLANNSKKLENTLSANSRAEDELRVMSHRLQESKNTSGSQQQLMYLSNGTNTNQNDSVPYAGGASALLESELRRVQEVVGDIQRQRQELSLAVRELTDRSQYVDRDTLSKQTLTSNATIKKRPQATWLETDLDLMITLEHGINIDGDEISNSKNSQKNLLNNTNNSSNSYSEGKIQDVDGDSDSETNAFGGLNINSQDRGEIKTVRIVKRESERRHRDRSEKTHSWGMAGNTSNLDHVIEEDTTRPKSVFENSTSTMSSTSQQQPYSNSCYDGEMKNTSTYTPKTSTLNYSSASNNIYFSNKYPSDNLISRDLPSENNLLANKYNSAEHFSSSQNLYGNPDYASSQNLYGSRDMKNLLKCESIVSLSKSAELSPVFHSQAAKEIISTINVNDVRSDDKYNTSEMMLHKRQVPKEKRRHYTAPTNDINMKRITNADGSYNNVGGSNISYNKESYDYRARDDLDMERALRTKSSDDSTTLSGSNSNAPDLVRSTIQDSDRDLLTKSSYSKDHDREFIYGSSYNSDKKNLYKSAMTSEDYNTTYNHKSATNKDDNYMDMSYSTKTNRNTEQNGDLHLRSNSFYDKYSDAAENYSAKQNHKSSRNSAFDDLSIYSTKRVDFTSKTDEFSRDKNFFNNDYSNDHSKDSKISSNDKYFNSEKTYDDDLGSNSLSSEQTSSNLSIKNTVVKDNRFSDNAIDKLLAAPSKILIPERYIPEQAPELSPEELERRQQKAESIRKMLSTTSITPTTNNTSNQEGQVNSNEKRQREHLLQLNQILAKEVMEMSKIVAGSNTNSTLQ